MIKSPPTLAAIATILVAAFLVACTNFDSRRSETSAPMIAVLEAAKHSDTKQFREAYSSGIRQDPGQSDWDKNLREAQATLKQKFGDYRLSDFAFSFEGDDLKGKLSISFKGKQQFAIAIVKEEGEWRLDER